MYTPSNQRPTQEPSEKSTEKQVNRACEACRLLKVRCLPDDSSPSIICQRCKRSGRICIYAAPQKRRQRIRTDTRVAELEREIRAMRSLLTGGDEPIAESRRGEKEVAAVTIVQDATDVDTGTTLSSGEERSSADGNNLSRQSSIPTSQSNTLDYGDGTLSMNVQSTPMETHGSKDFGLLSQETSNQLFESYNNDLVQHYPAVLFSKSICSDEVRKSKPVLFQAVVTAAACQLHPDIFAELFKKMTKVYAERIFINGEKSLELIQSLMLTSVWYCPPDESCGPSNLHFYQYIHMAATMALDLGMGLAVDKEVVPIDECRTLLACYLNCAGIAMRMRRPNMLHWTGGMSDCLEVLESSPESTFLDRRLAAWVRLQNVADEWCKSVGSTNSYVELSIKGFERQLQKWKEAAGPGVINTSLALAYHQDSIYLHESALESGATTLVDFNHKIFKPPSKPPIRPAKEEAQPPLTAAYVNAVMSCISSSHDLLDEFLTTDVRSLRVVPIIHFVRSSYAIVVLVKLFISASVPSNELSKILDRQVLKVDHYLEAILTRLTEAAGPNRLRVPSKWLEITRQINDWYHKHLMAFGRGQRYNREGVDAQENEEAACSANATACGTDAIRPSSEPNVQPPWGADSVPTITSFQEHASHNVSSHESASQHSYNTGALPATSDPLAIDAEPDNQSPFSTTVDPSSSLPLEEGDFTAMDFTQDDLSFLNIPGVAPGSFNSWMPMPMPMPDGDGDGGNGMLLADMNFDQGSDDNWGFDF